MSSFVHTISSVPLSDWYTSLIAIIFIAASLTSVEFGIKYFNFPSLYTRKFIHIITGLIICIVAYFLSSNVPLIIFATAYIFIDFWSLKKGKFKSIHPDTKSFGTLFYAISIIILAILFWDPNKSLFIITNLIMIIPDAMAAILGDLYARRYFIPLKEKKSLVGALTMFILTFLIVFVLLEYFYHNPRGTHLLIAIIVGAIATVSEIVSYRGSDNLSVPLFSGLFLYILLILADSGMFFMIILGTILASIVALLSMRIHFLDLGGAALAFLMGSIIFGLGGWAYTFPILGFFILSSFLSRIGRTKKKQIEANYQKTGIRDFHQALANGGVATAIVLIAFFTQIESFYYAYVTSLAVATADTWGTELGVFSRSKPLLISNFKPVEPGTSGGISLVGTFSALAGSIIIVLISSLFHDYNSYQFAAITIIGFSGSLVDSILGATVQGQFKCENCSISTESKFHCKSKTRLIHGYHWIDNDLVNIFSILISAILSIIIIY